MEDIEQVDIEQVDIEQAGIERVDIELAGIEQVGIEQVGIEQVGIEQVDKWLVDIQWLDLGKEVDRMLWQEHQLGCVPQAVSQLRPDLQHHTQKISASDNSSGQHQ